MNRKVIVSCAVTGSGDTAKKHPDLPKTPAQIAKAAIEALGGKVTDTVSPDTDCVVLGTVGGGLMAELQAEKAKQLGIKTLNESSFKRLFATTAKSEKESTKEFRCYHWLEDYEEYTVILEAKNIKEIKENWGLIKTTINNVCIDGYGEYSVYVRSIFLDDFLTF